MKKNEEKEIGMKGLVENMGIAYKNKKGSRKEYKCKVLGRQVLEDWTYEVFSPNGGGVPKKHTVETLKLVFMNKDRHDLTHGDLYVITDYNACNTKYSEEERYLKCWSVKSNKVLNKAFGLTELELERDIEQEKEIFKVIPRIENNTLPSNEVLGILKDRFLTKKIFVEAWPGLYLDKKDKTKAYPIGVRFFLGEDIETDFTIQITDQGLWEVDDKEVENIKDIKLKNATIQQLKSELNRKLEL